MSNNEFIDTYNSVRSPFDYLPNDGEILPVLKDAFGNGGYLSDVIETVSGVTLPLDKSARKRTIASIRQEGLIAQWHAEDLRRQGDPAASDVRELANMVSEVASMYGTARPGVRREHDEVELEISRNLHRSPVATEAHWTAFARDSQVVHGEIHRAFGVPSTVEVLPVSQVVNKSLGEKSLFALNNKQRAVATVLATTFLSGLMPSMAQAVSETIPPQTPEVKSMIRSTAEVTNPRDPNDPANLIALATPTPKSKETPAAAPTVAVSEQPVSVGPITSASANTSYDGSGDETIVASTVLQETNQALLGLTPAPISVVAAPNLITTPADLGTPEVASPTLGGKDGIGLVPAPVNAISKPLDNTPGSEGTPEVAAPVAPALPPVEVVPTPEPAPAPVPATKTPDTPAPAPADPEKPTQVPDVILDPSLASETLWPSKDIAYMQEHLDMYTNAEKQSGVPWEVIAALHEREASMGMTNPVNGQGVFQLYSSGIRFAPGPITKEEFTRQAVLAANLLKSKAHALGYTDAQISLANPDIIKDILFSYNGRAQAYARQATALGFKNPAEGSPYVMNLADAQRDSNINSNWGQILTDNGPLGKATRQPGAWPLIDGLQKIEKIAHDRATADTQKKADPATSTPEKKATDENSQFNGWTYPVPKGTPITSGFGARGEGGKHDGEDFGANTGTPFYAAAGGVAKVIVVDVRVGSWCNAALEPLGMNVSQVADPIQKEVHITSVINGHTYETIYAHLSSVEVAPNQTVAPGTEIGKTGGSGCSTGPHAHFEVRRDGVPIDPAIILDPAKWQAQLGHDIKVASVDSESSTVESITTTTNMPAGTISAIGDSTAQQTVERAKRAVAAAKAATEQVQREKKLIK